MPKIRFLCWVMGYDYWIVGYNVVK